MKAIVSLALGLIWLNSLAQVPESISYQAIARDLDGEFLVNQLVSFRITILSGSASGTAEYIETHSGRTTNEFGLVELEI